MGSTLSFACGVSVLVMLSSGCSGRVVGEAPGDVSDAAAPDVTAFDDRVESDCMAWAQAECNLARQCAPVAYAYQFPSEGGCMADAPMICSRARRSPGVAPGAPDFLACASALATFDCASYTGHDPLPDACYFHGLLDDGTPCASSVQCAGGCCKIGDDNALCGACGEPSTGPFACQYYGDCPLGMGCHNGACAPSVGLGHPCIAAPCKANLVCDQGVCSPPRLEGAPCTTENDECDGYQLLYCHPFSHTCVRFTVVPMGAECGWMGDLAQNGYYAVCEGAGVCDTSGSKWVCKPWPAEGDSCDDTLDPPCSGIARCVGGVCSVAEPLACVEQ